MWMQCNHFEQSGISLKASVARIPWMGSSFTGFISGLWLGDRLVQFTTYNGTRLRKCFADQHHVQVVLQNRKHELVIQVERDGATSLASPLNGLMDGRIEESMTSKMNIQLTERSNGRLLFEGKGNHAAVEVAGKVESIMTRIK
jgi:hypothetical protein